MKIRTAVALLLFTSCAAIAGGPATSDLGTIRRRIIASLLPAGDEATGLVITATAMARQMGGSGSWPDVDYADAERNNWKLKAHLDRALLLAKAAAVSRRDGNLDRNLVRGAVGALDYWLAHDFKNPNWWWNEIGVPQLTGEAVLLLGADCPAATREGVVALMKRSVWTKWTGQNLVWGVTNQVTRGLITEDPALVSAAYARMYDEVVITMKDGIQPDFSFHQHGDQLYSGGYGLGFANDVGRYIAFAWGTSFGPSAKTMIVYDGFMLDGEAWMTWGNLFDYSAMGREIVRKGKVAAPDAWTDGPIAPVGAAYGLYQTTSMLADAPVWRHAEYQAFAARLVRRTGATPLNGHRHFWRSDYSVHRRAGYMFSVKMFSTRLQNAELVNNEGRLSHHLGDGNTFLYRTGKEYRDVFAVWDWNRVPGTTAEQPPAASPLTAAAATRPAWQQGFLDSILPKGNRDRGKTSFVGGVSDGQYGASAMELSRGKLSAKKSWFFFDDQIVCLGSGIACESGNQVVTSVEQCFANGPVTEGPGDLWVHHNGVGYVFLGHQDVLMRKGMQNGAWSELGTGSTAREEAEVFSLGVDHGTRPGGSRYGYVILPGATAGSTKQSYLHPDVEVLEQSDAVHAVRNAKQDVTSIVFFAAGKAADIEVDRPCIVTVHGDKLTVCNPVNTAATVRVTVKGHPVTVDLPGDAMAGSSVTVVVK